MPDVQKINRKPLVVLVSGYMGCGKTRFVEALVKALGNAPALIFDHYEDYAEWPDDFGKWIQDGADPNQIRVPKLKDDLHALCKGISITHPIDDRMVHPSDTILVEEPFGTERGEITKFVDLVVYIDVPEDVCVVRIIQRALGMNDFDFERDIELETRDGLQKRVKSVAFWLNHYLAIRPGLTLTEIIRQKADIIVDGMKPVGEMVQDALEAIKLRGGS
jgi:dephospho-CoA kinase